MSEKVIINGVEYVPRDMDPSPGDWRRIETPRVLHPHPLDASSCSPSTISRG